MLWVHITRFGVVGCFLQIDTFSDTILVGSFFDRGVCNLFSEEIQKLFNEESKEREAKIIREHYL